MSIFNFFLGPAHAMDPNVQRTITVTPTDATTVHPGSGVFLFDISNEGLIYNDVENSLTISGFCGNFNAAFKMTSTTGVATGTLQVTPRLEVEMILSTKGATFTLPKGESIGTFSLPVGEAVDLPLREAFAQFQSDIAGT